MREEDDEVYFNDPEFLEYLQTYEQARKDGEPIYMDAEELTDIAEFYMTQNRESEANEAISLALSLHPNSVDPLIFLARQQMFHDNLEKAIEIAHTIPDQQDKETIFLWMELLIRSDKPDEALQLIESQLDELDEDKETFLYDAASIFIDYQYNEMADQLIKTLEEKYPQNNKLWKLKTDNFIENEEYDKAIELLQEYIDEHPYNFVAWKKLAEAHALNEEHLEALDCIEYCLAIKPNYKMALLQKSQSLVRLNHMDKAHQIYAELLKKEPRNGRLFYMDAITLANMENFEDARTQINNALKYTPAYDEDRIQFLINKAFIEGKSHNVDEASKALDEARRLSKNCEEIEYNLFMGEIYLENGMETEAAEQFGIAYKESKNKQQTLLTMGIAYAETMHYQTALSLLESYEQEYEGQEGVIAIPYLAYCYKRIHDQENYLKYLRKAVSADREITEYLFAKDYPSIQPEEYYLYAFKNAYGRFPESWE